MGQMRLSDYEYSSRKKKTKRDEFLEIINLGPQAVVRGINAPAPTTVFS